MSQGDLPVIHGSNWRASAALKFNQPLLADAARTEVLRFVAQRHDGHLFLVANVWDVLIENEPDQFEGDAWHAFTNRFVEAVHRGLQAQIKAKMEGDEAVEVIPRRSMNQFLDRRSQHFLIDLRLTFRRLGPLHGDWDWSSSRMAAIDDQNPKIRCSFEDHLHGWYAYS